MSPRRLIALASALAVILAGPAPARAADPDPSWTQRALTLQRDLGDPVPLGDAQWVATHNSFNSTAYPPTLSNQDPNQQLSLGAQLDLGARGLELDVHWFQTSSGTFAPLLCHGTPQHVGCTQSDRPLAEGIDEIRAWLDDHPGEVLMLDIEDHLDTEEGYATAAAVIEEGLQGLLYPPDPAAHGGCQAIPLDGTRAEVLVAAAQVIVTSGCGIGTGWPALAFSTSNRDQSVNEGFRAYPDCDLPDRDFDYTGSFVRFWDDSTFLTATTNPDAERIDAPAAREMVRCEVNMVSLDQLVEADGRLPAQVWSWAEGEPSVTADGTCARHGADARLAADGCRRPLRFACLDPATGAWAVTRRAGRFSAGARSCAAAAPGSVFTVPRTGLQNQRLREAKAADGVAEVWVDYEAVGGVWVADPS